MLRTLPILVLVALLGICHAERTETVHTTTGDVVGVVVPWEGTHSSGSHKRFQGIPYAEPPVGSRRFQEPEPVQSWEGVKDCTGGPPSMCPQLDFFNMDPANPGKISGSEDCLFLNIYTRDLPSTDMTSEAPLKPVLFYIHGGGFAMGSGAGMMGMENSAEDYLMESDIVLVTINYRLGPLGFMAIPGTNIQGNMGMKDQVLAMRWVKQNIARFGGDPGRITISGLSAGAVSVHAHVLSPEGEGEGLFHRAISHSGTMLMPIDSEGVFEDSRTYYEKMCNVNLTVEEVPEDMAETCLFTLSAEQLISESVKTMAVWALPLEEKIEMEKNDPSYMGYRMWVVVDDWADHPFMPNHPITILHNQQQKMVPFMTGVTSEEGALLAPQLWKDMDPANNVVEKNWGFIGAKNLYPGLREYSFDHELKAKMVAHFYVGKDGLVRENKQGLMDMFTDVFFAAPNTEAVRLHAKAPAPVYNYLFSYKGSFSFSNFYAAGHPEATKEDWGVAHGDDIMYLSKMVLKGQVMAGSEEDKRMVDIYRKLITNFIRYGNPTPVEYTDIPKWHPAQKSRAACVYMDINLKPEERHRMFSERMTFWNMFQYKEMLEEYAVDNKEARMLIEIESAIDETEEDVESEIEDDEEEVEVGGHQRKGGRRGVQRRRKARLERRWRKRGDNRFNKLHKKKNVAKLEARKRRRLAKKLRKMME